jgi:spore coat polysaccharide biosynthesis predicted glycosyltransferase SpsG
MAFSEIGWDSKLRVQPEISAPGLPLEHLAAPWHNLASAWQSELEQSALVVLDSYRAPQSTIDAIIARAKNFSAIDDFPHRDYPHGTIIDGSLNAEHDAYPARRGAVNYLLGSRFACLRPAFRGGCIHRPTAIERLLVSFGSGDIRALTTPALESIFSTLPLVRVDILTGDAAAARQLARKHEGLQAIFHPPLDALSVQQLMLDCDLAVCGGGQTLYELAACGVPAVAIELIENQHQDLINFAAAGFIDFAGHWQDDDLWLKLGHALATLQRSPTTLAQRAATGQSLVDGQGAGRVARFLANSTTHPAAPRHF